LADAGSAVSEAAGLRCECRRALVERHEALEVPGVDSRDDRLEHLLRRGRRHLKPPFRYTVMCHGIATIRASGQYVNIGDTEMSHEVATKRKYELKKRAEEMAGTHLRITEAAIELHGT